MFQEFIFYTLFTILLVTCCITGALVDDNIKDRAALDAVVVSTTTLAGHCADICNPRQKYFSIFLYIHVFLHVAFAKRYYVVCEHTYPGTSYDIGQHVSVYLQAFSFLATMLFHIDSFLKYHDYKMTRM